MGRIKAMAFDKWVEYTRVVRYEILSERIVRLEESQRKLLTEPLMLVLRGRRDAELERVTVSDLLFILCSILLTCSFKSRDVHLLVNFCGRLALTSSLQMFPGVTFLAILIMSLEFL